MPEEDAPSTDEKRRKTFSQSFANKLSQSPEPDLVARAQILRKQEELLEEDPRNTGVWVSRALLLYDLKRYPEALACLEKVLEIDPKFPGLYAARAEVLAKLERPRDGEEKPAGSTGLKSVLARPTPSDYQKTIDERGALVRALQRGLDELEREILHSEPAAPSVVAVRPAPEEKAPQAAPAKPRFLLETVDVREPGEAAEGPLPPAEEASPPTPSPAPRPEPLPSPPRRLPEPDPEQIAIRARLQAWRREGFDVSSIERLLTRSPESAAESMASFGEKIDTARDLRARLQSLGRSDPEVLRVLELLKRPYDLPLYEDEIRAALESPAPASAEPARLSQGHETPRSPSVRARGPAESVVGRTNGLTNGRKGRTNGLTNGRKGRTNGVTDGLTNGVGGRTNGLTNGRRSRFSSRGQTNGLTNGTRGQTNGLLDGLESTRAGITNGLTNGLGMTNGLGAVKYQAELRAAKWKLYLVALSAMILLAVPMFSQPGPDVRFEETLISVDGDLGDWAGLSTAHRVEHALNLSSVASTDITETGLIMGLTKVGGYVQVRGAALGGHSLSETEDAIHVFFDGDGSVSTGYQIGGLGAERAVRVRGVDGQVTEATLLGYDVTADGLDWNGWRPYTSIEAAVSGGVIEFSFPLDALQASVTPRVHAATQAWNRRGDEADTALGFTTGRLLATQRSLAPLVTVPGSRQDFLEITLQALDAPVTVSSLTITLGGTLPTSGLADVPPQLREGGASPVAGTPSGTEVAFVLGRTVDPLAPVALTLSAGAGLGTDGSSLGFSVSGSDRIVADGSVSLRSTGARGLSHVGSVPTLVEVDGAFGEWSPNPITAGSPGVAGNPSIDLVGVATQMRPAGPTTSVFAFAEVAGALFSGSPFPATPYQRPAAGTPDTDRDTVPDSEDLLPSDFDNDGIPDAQEIGDVDSDALIDWPAGTDQFLETTLPANFPAPYGGRTVRVYIGPVTPPPATGVDTLRVYLDTDGVPSNGYLVENVYAEYMLRVTGKNGRIIGRDLYRFPPTAIPGDGDAWEWIGTLEASKDVRRIELSAAVPQPINASSTEVVFRMEDALGGQDTDRRPLTRSVAGPGTRGSTLIDASSNAVTSQYNHQRKTVRAGDVSGDTACDGTNSDGCWYDVFADQLPEPTQTSNYPSTETITTGCKLGYGFPVSDVDTGTWTTAPLWSKLDDYSDTDYIQSLGGAGTYDTLGVSPLCDPYSSSNHIMYFRARADPANSGAGEKLKMDLYQASTQIATSGAVAVAEGAGFTTYSYTLTALETDAITDYGDLRFRLWVDTAGASEVLYVAYATLESSVTFGTFPPNAEDGTVITYRESRENPEAVVAYNSADTSGESYPKTRVWDGEGWGAQAEQGSGSSPRGVSMAMSPTAADTYIFITQGYNGYIYAYVCTPSCAAPATIGRVWNTAPPPAGSTGGLRASVAYEQSSGEALVVYGVYDADTTHDLAFKTYVSGSWSSEQFIDDPGHSSDLQYWWVKTAAKSGSNQIALIGGEEGNDDVNAWIWDGSSWGNYVAIENSSVNQIRGAGAIAWETSSGHLLAVTQTNQSSSIVSKEYTTSWGSASSYTCLSGANTATYMALVPNPVSASNDMIVAISDSASDLSTCYWSGSAWSNYNNHEGALCSGEDRCADFAWEASGSKGLLVWAQNNVQLVHYRTLTAPNGWGSISSAALGSSDENAWPLLRTVPFPRSGASRITGVINVGPGSPYDLAALKWDGTTFTVVASPLITANENTGSWEHQDHRHAIVPEDAMLVQYDWSGVPEGISYALVVKGYREDEDINVQVYDGSGWNARITISATSSTAYAYTLTDAEYQSGAPKVRFVDASGAVGYASDLYLDWVLIEATSSVTAAGSETITTGTKQSGTFPTSIQTKNAAYIQYREAADALSIKYDWSGLPAAVSHTLYVKGYLSAGDKRVNQNTDSTNQEYQSFAVDSSGNVIVAWQDDRNGVSNKDIYAQKLDSNGNPLWGATDVKVNQNSDSANQMRPSVAIDSSGNAIIAWEDERSGTTNDHIYAQKLDSSGAAQWGATDIKVNQNSDSAVQAKPSVAATGTSSVIAWEDARAGAGNEDIYAQKLDSSGAAQWGSTDIKVNQNSDTKDQWEPQAAIDSGGNALLAWYDYRSCPTPCTADVYAQKLDASGAAQWGSTDVKVNRNGDSLDQKQPRLAVTGTSAVVVWWDNRNGGTYPWDAYAQKIDSSGSPQWGSTDVKVNQNSDSQNQQGPSVAVDGSGNSYVAWYDYRNSPNADVFSQKLDSSGTAQWGGTDKQVNVLAGGTMWSQWIGLSSGLPVVAWMDYRNPNTDIFAQKLDGSGNRLWTENVKVEVLTPPSTWTTRITMTSATNTLYPVLLTGPEFNSGAPSIRFVDYGGTASKDGNSDTWIDFAAVSANSHWDRIVLMRSTATDATTWGDQVVLASGRAGHNPLVLRRDSAEPSVALDSSGALHVAWVAASSAGDQTTMNLVRYSKSTVTYPIQSELAAVSNWEAVTSVDDASTGFMPTVSTDTGNNPHLAWSASKSSGTAYYKSKYGGTWRSTVSFTGGLTGHSVDVSPQNNYVSLTRLENDPTELMIAYRSESGLGNNYPKVRLWDGSWGGEQEQGTSGNTLNHLRSAWAPSGNERIFVTLGSDGYLDAYVCDPVCTVTNNIAQAASAGPTINEQRADIAYEQVSGQALLAYSEVNADTTKDIAYRVWDGTAWGAEQYLDDTSASTNNTYRQVVLAAQPGTDKIGLIVGDSTDNDAVAWIWDGSAWGSFTNVTATGANMTYTSVDLAWESSSGHLLAASLGPWQDNTYHYKEYTTSWSSEQTSACSDGSNENRALRLVADPVSTSNGILGASHGNPNYDLETCYWDGSSWGTRVTQDGGLDTSSRRPYDFAWEPTGSKGILVYGTTSAKITYKTFTPPSTWSLATEPSMGSDLKAWVQLRTNPNWESGEPLVYGAVLEQNTQDLGAISWDGTTLTVVGATTFSANVGSTLYEAFDLEWRSTATGQVHYAVCKDIATSTCDAAAEFKNWDATAIVDVVASSVVGLGTYSSTMTYPSLATTREANGDLWVAYSKNYAVDDAGIYARFLDYPTSGWQAAELADTLAGADTLMYPSVGLDDSGKVYVLYSDVAGGPDVYYNVRDGTWGSRVSVSDNADKPSLAVRMPIGATYGSGMGGVYFMSAPTETYHYYVSGIPEFSDLAAPLLGLFGLLVLRRYRERRRAASR